MKNIPQHEWIEWKKNRRNTLIGFIIVGTIVGIDYSFMFTTLYLYLKDMIKTDNPDVFYGLIIGIYCMASTIFGVILARWVDQYRKVKLFTFIVLILQIIGILLYVIPTSVVYAMVGRFICGIGDPYTNVCSGEVVRIYDQEEGTSALWWLAACYSLGFMIGPVVVFFFRNVDFYICGIHFNQLNSIGIFIAGLSIIALFAVYFLIHDCSAIIDLKMYLKENGRLDTVIDNIKTDIPVEKRNPTNSERILLLSKDENALSVNNYYSVNGEGSTQMRRSWETESIRSILCAMLTNVDTLLMSPHLYSSILCSQLMSFYRYYLMLYCIGV